MTRRKMFMRMITASLVRRRSRMVVALLAIAVGATILSGLVTIYYDIPRQMGAQFRNYGANMIFLASGSDADFNMDSVNEAVSHIDSSNLLGVTPFRYETVRIHEQPVVAAGTDMKSAQVTSPYWHIEGEWPDSDKEVLVGKKMAELLGLEEGDSFNVPFVVQEDPDSVLNLGIDMKVSGILDTGGSEEDYVYMHMADLEELAGATERLDVAELSVSAAQDELKAYAETISEKVDGVSASLVKRVTQSESTVLKKLQALVFIVTVVVLILTMICVANTMTAVVAERRKEIGLRKALGASDKGIIWEFMGEGLLLGGIGGLIGSFSDSRSLSSSAYTYSEAPLHSSRSFFPLP